MDATTENEQYYVRWRGKLSGPFDVEQLQEMAAEDRLSRLHDVSTDQADWHRAETMVAVYPAHDVDGTATQTLVPDDVADQAPDSTEGTPPDQADEEEGVELAIVEDDSGLWYYARDRSGTQRTSGNAGDLDVKGPHPIEMITQLVLNGYLLPDDYVNPGTSASGWMMVRDEPELASAAASVARHPIQASAGTGMSAGAAKEYSTLAGTSLKLSVIGILVPIFGFVGMICGILARLALAGGGPRDAKSSATGGIILGIVDVLLDVVKTLVVLRLLDYI